MKVLIEFALVEANNGDMVRLHGKKCLAIFLFERMMQMIHKTKPELTLYLAEEALKKKFTDDDIGLHEMLELQRDCRDYLSTESIRKIYARMMKIEVTKIMVETVYRSLSAEEQKFVVMRYKKRKNLVAISLALNMSIAQLSIHQHEILEKVSEFMLYRLNEEDIFNRDKIVSMIKLLKRIIEFAEQYDPTREFISVNWLEAIIEHHDRYCRLLKAVDETLCGDSILAKIISAKMANPNEKLEFLAEKCNLDKSGISRYLKIFADSMRKYLE